ncbi:WRC [Musa troglodytarum]|uniref:WRC n=1 Tax=Musa troglodytarum TaxID=320322 RepID=A0A9E7HUE2_9LILI|nr:WRC [Musa troglodytarum]
MRIRNRPNPFPPPLFPDPSVHVHPADGEDGRKDSNGGDRGRGRGMLHSDADLEIDNLNRRPPTSEPRLMSSGSSRKATVFAHRANLGRVQVLRKKAKEEDGMVDTSNRWDAEVNGNSSSSAPVSAAEQVGDAVFLAKKKRGGNDYGCGNRGSEDKREEKEKKPKGRGRAKMRNSSVDNGACSRVNGSDHARRESEVKEEEEEPLNGNVPNGKKRRSPAVLMEGSRCSRVNGRGWRCCQQTLVGYSLCEHHLGKGRLRSMTSVRGQLGTSTARSKRSPGGATTIPEEEAEEEEKEKLWPQQYGAGEIKMEEDNEKTSTLKRKKIGMVKARTISSLLDETNRPVPSLLSQPPQVAFMQTLDGREAMV